MVTCDFHSYHVGFDICCSNILKQKILYIKKHAKCGKIHKADVALETTQVTIYQEEEAEMD